MTDSYPISIYDIEWADDEGPKLHYVDFGREMTREQIAAYLGTTYGTPISFKFRPMTPEEIEEWKS